MLFEYCHENILNWEINRMRYNLFTYSKRARVCKMTRVLITGTAGFIGFHLANVLLAEGLRVHGYDGMTDYYDVTLKQRRHAMLLQNSDFSTTQNARGSKQIR